MSEQHTGEQTVKPTISCPKCGFSIELPAEICPSCRYNLRTGEVFRDDSLDEADGDDGSRKKHLLIGVTVGLVVIALALFLFMGRDDSPHNPPTASQGTDSGGAPIQSVEEVLGESGGLRTLSPGGDKALKGAKGISEKADERRDMEKELMEATAPQNP